MSPNFSFFVFCFCCFWVGFFYRIFVFVCFTTPGLSPQVSPNFSVVVFGWVLFSEFSFFSFTTPGLGPQVSPSLFLLFFLKILVFVCFTTPGLSPQVRGSFRRGGGGGGFREF